MIDIIEDIKGIIIESMPNTSPDWAEYCAIAPLSTILHNAKVINKMSSLNVNLIMMAIGLAGCGKSLPMFRITYPIIMNLSERLGMDLLIPNRFSVEGIIKYFGEQNDDTLRRDVGLMMRDEFSGWFKQMRKADWQSDGMEFLSEMYDGTYHKRVTTGNGLQRVERLHISILTASTPYFISKMDSDFFTQGTGNRILYDCFNINEYKIGLSEDFFCEDWESERNVQVEEITGNMELLYKKNIQKLYIGSGADKLWFDFHDKCEAEWKEKCINNPFSWDYYPVKRYPELALKLAGIYEVSSRAERIISHTNFDGTFVIEEEQMARAIATMERNRLHFREIVKIKNSNIARKKPESIEDEAIVALQILKDVPDSAMTSIAWFAGMPFSQREKKQEIKNFLVEKGYVKVLGYKDLSDEEIKKWNVVGGRAQVVKYIKGL